MQFTNSQYIYLKSILILSFHLSLVLPSEWFLPFRFSTQNSMKIRDNELVTDLVITCLASFRFDQHPGCFVSMTLSTVYPHLFLIRCFHPACFHRFCTPSGNSFLPLSPFLWIPITWNVFLLWWMIVLETDERTPNADCLYVTINPPTGRDK
jgi:hypothetical protein